MCETKRYRGRKGEGMCVRDTEGERMCVRDTEEERDRGRLVGGNFESRNSVGLCVTQSDRKSPRDC